MPLLILLATLAGVLTLSVATLAFRKAVDVGVQADLALRQIHDLVGRAQAIDAELRHLGGRVSRLETPDWPVALPPREAPTADLPS